MSPQQQDRNAPEKKPCRKNPSTFTPKKICIASRSSHRKTMPRSKPEKISRLLQPRRKNPSKRWTHNRFLPTLLSATSHAISANRNKLKNFSNQRTSIFPSPLLQCWLHRSPRCWLHPSRRCFLRPNRRCSFCRSRWRNRCNHLCQIIPSLSRGASLPIDRS